jgi:predicted transcriptional regulator
MDDRTLTLEQVTLGVDTDAEQHVAAALDELQEAVERFVDYDHWFLREVDKGLAAAERAELVDHEEVGKQFWRSRHGGGSIQSMSHPSTLGQEREP